MENNKRKSGRTTRLADQIIQDLFDEDRDFAVIADHYQHRAFHVRLKEIVLSRLEREHGILREDLIVKRLNGTNALTIELKIKEEPKVQAFRLNCYEARVVQNPGENGYVESIIEREGQREQFDVLYATTVGEVDVYLTKSKAKAEWVKYQDNAGKCVRIIIGVPIEPGTEEILFRLDPDNKIDIEVREA